MNALYIRATQHPLTTSLFRPFAISLFPSTLTRGEKLVARLELFPSGTAGHLARVAHDGAEHRGEFAQAVAGRADPRSHRRRPSRARMVAGIFQNRPSPRLARLRRARDFHFAFRAGSF